MSLRASIAAEFSEDWSEAAIHRATPSATLRVACGRL